MTNTTANEKIERLNAIGDTLADTTNTGLILIKKIASAVMAIRAYFGLPEKVDAVRYIPQNEDWKHFRAIVAARYEWRSKEIAQTNGEEYNEKLTRNRFATELSRALVQANIENPTAKARAEATTAKAKENGIKPTEPAKKGRKARPAEIQRCPCCAGLLVSVKGKIMMAATKPAKVKAKAPTKAKGAK